MAGNWDEEWGEALYSHFKKLELQHRNEGNKRGYRYPSQSFNEIRGEIERNRLDVDVIDRNGNSPIGEAIKSRDFTMMNYLFGEKRADPNIPVQIYDSKERGSTVFLALTDPVVLEEVLQNRGNPNAKTSKSGTTPILSVMPYYFDTDEPSVIESIDERGRRSRSILLQCLTTLYKYGATPNTKDKFGIPPLIRAVTSDKPIPSVALIETLLKNGESPNSVDNGDNTALHWISHITSHDIDERDSDEIFVKNELISVAILLLRYGADRTLKNKDGTTAEDINPDTFEYIYNEFSRQKEVRSRGRDVRGLVESEKEPLSKKVPEDVADNISSFLTGKEGPIKHQMAELKEEAEEQYGGRRSRLHKKTRRSKGKRGHTKRR